MNWLKENWFRVGIVLMMLVALGDQPYSYYQFLRWVTTITSFYLAYYAHTNKNVTWTWIFIVVGIFFNPIVPFYLEKETWRFFNVTVAAIYFISLFKFKLNHEKDN